MRHRITALSAAALVTLGACSEAPVAPAAPMAPDAASLSTAGAGQFQVPTKHLVMFKGQAPADFEQRVSALGGTVTLNHKLGIAVVVGLSDADAPTLQAQVRADYVEPMPTFQLIEPAALAELEVAAADAAGTSVSSVANPAAAFFFAARQWNMRQVKADVAWAAGQLGSADVTVAILDTGIDPTLPDLNGLVDLDRSVSFEPLDDLYAAFYYPGAHVSTDLHYHGTNVATQVASKAAWYAGVTSRTTLMSVKVCSFAGGCHGVTEGMLYAIDNGADVINMSLGGWFRKSAYPGAVSAFNRIMNYAKQQGVTVVVAAGNSAIDLDRQDNIPVTVDGNIVRVHIPSFFATYCDATQVICVAATTLNDAPASYSNYGRSAIDVAAPGGGNGSWVYALCPRTSLLYNCGNPAFVYSLGVSGTSQATPHVAGLAALAVERVGRNPAQVKSLIRNSADAIGGGNTPQYGKGRINVARAIGL